MEKILETAKHQINMLLEEKNFVIVAIDGKCTSGKTTLASQLAEIYDCNVFHMDDFFLRPEQRTPERFYKEVLLPLKTIQPFSYRPFDCKTFTLSEPVAVAPKRLNIVEGSYSHHPYFGNPYDLKILLTVDEETQRQRILERPAFLHKRLSCSPTSEKHQFDVFHCYVPPSILSALIVPMKGLSDKCAANDKNPRFLRTGD